MWAIIFSMQQYSSPIYGLSIVNTNQVYSPKELNDDLWELSQKYPEIITVKSIGQTKYGRHIWAVKLGNGEATVLMNGAHHAREWMTTMLLMEMIEQYVVAYYENTSIDGYHVKEILDQTSIWFVPMVNPDGVALQQGELDSFPEEAQEYLLKINGGSRDFSAWKANAEGIDNNRQYPADWETIQDSKPNPGPSRYKGTAPLVTNETKALVDFTYEIDPQIATSYHSSGQIIYWN